MLIKEYVKKQCPLLFFLKSYYIWKTNVIFLHFFFNFVLSIVLSYANKIK